MMTLSHFLLPRFALPALLLTACPKADPDTSESATGTASTSSASDSASSMPTSETGGTAGTSVCSEACAHLFECGNQLLAPSVAGCISLCESADLLDTELCRATAQGWYACLADAPCEDTNPGPAGACAVPFAAYNVSCIPCFASFDTESADECYAEAECPDTFAITYACKGNTCTCSLDDEFASCPAAGVCAGDEAALQAAAEACCGLAFTPFTGPG
jgi:hypothetical protein